MVTLERVCFGTDRGFYPHKSWKGKPPAWLPLASLTYLHLEGLITVKQGKRAWRVAGGLLALVGILLGWSWSKAGKQTRRLVDGSNITLERVSVGTNTGFYPHKPWKEKLPGRLPKLSRRLIGPNGRAHQPGLARPELFCWVTFPEDLADSLIPWLQIADEHGCVFHSTDDYCEGESGIAVVYGFSFRTFPRRSERLKIQVVQKGRVVTEFDVANPAKGEFPTWTGESPPATRHQKGLLFELKTIPQDMKELEPLRDWHDWSPPTNAWPDCEVAVSRDGLPQAGWRVMDVRFEDVTGNTGPGLCSYESAWKIDIELARSAEDAFPDSEVWQLGKLAVPEPGQVKKLGLSKRFGRVPVTVEGIGGPGNYTYSNFVCIASKPRLPVESAEKTSAWMESGVFPNILVAFHPHLLLRLPIWIGPGSLATLRGKDDTGRSIIREGRPARIGSKLPTFVDLPPGAKSVELELILQETERVTFFVKPPAPKQPIDHRRPRPWRWN
jgi:hypothetical protein